MMTLAKNSSSAARPIFSSTCARRLISNASAGFSYIENKKDLVDILGLAEQETRCALHRSENRLFPCRARRHRAPSEPDEKIVVSSASSSTRYFDIRWSITPPNWWAICSLDFSGRFRYPAIKD